MDLSNIELNNLSKDELINIINNQIKNEGNTILKMEEEGFFDCSVPDTTTLDSFSNIDFNIGLDDALVESNEDDNRKNISYCEKNLKNIEQQVSSIKEDIFAHDFKSFFEKKIINIKNYLPEEQYPDINDFSMLEWKNLYDEHASKYEFYTIFINLQNQSNVEDIYLSIKENYYNKPNKQYNDKKDWFQHMLRVQWLEGYKKIDDSEAGLCNVSKFIEVFKKDPDLSDDYKDNFIKSMFFCLFEQNYHIKNLDALKNTIFEHANIQEKDLQWGSLLLSVYHNISNLSHYSTVGGDNNVPQTVIDRMENEIFQFFTEKGFLKKWFCEHSDLPETKDFYDNGSLYSFVSSIKNNEKECTFNSLFNQFHRVPNMQNYLLIKREKFILQEKLNIDNQEHEVKKIKRI